MRGRAGARLDRRIVLSHPCPPPRPPPSTVPGGRSMAQHPTSLRPSSEFELCCPPAVLKNAATDPHNPWLARHFVKQERTTRPIPRPLQPPLFSSLIILAQTVRSGSLFLSPVWDRVGRTFSFLLCALEGSMGFLNDSTLLSDAAIKYVSNDRILMIAAVILWLRCMRDVFEGIEHH